MYLRAMRNASIAMKKQSDGVLGATMATEESPLRPNIAWSKSDCSVFVGMPVEGPARCTSMTTRGSSVMTARLRASLLRASPARLCR